MDNIAQENNPNSIMTDEYSEEILRFLLSLQTANDKKRIRIMRSYPNKIAYKWVKRYDVMVVESSNVLIYKQEDGSPLDSCKKVVKYSNRFDAVCELHEMQEGNDHPKSKTLYRRVTSK
jgi:lipopolysaccharide biosynthesis protein